MGGPTVKNAKTKKRLPSKRQNHYNQINKILTITTINDEQNCSIKMTDNWSNVFKLTNLTKTPLTLPTEGSKYYTTP